MAKSGHMALFGTPCDNVLLLDQARGGLLAAPASGWRVTYTWSPFFGECDAINVVATGSENMEQAMKALLAAQ